MDEIVTTEVIARYVTEGASTELRLSFVLTYVEYVNKTNDTHIEKRTFDTYAKAKELYDRIVVRDGNKEIRAFVVIDAQTKG